MANWKKVIVSGSSAQLSQLSVDTSINVTGSLNSTGSVFLKGLTNTSQPYIVGFNDTTGQLYYQGTGSFSANSASYALTASYINPLTQSVGILGDVSISGSTGITGSLSATGSLSIAGATTVTGSLTIAGDTQISSSLGVTGSSSITGSFGVTGSSSITGSLDVAGATTITGSLSIAADTQISSSLGITGSAGITGSFGVTGSSSITGSLSIAGVTTVTGSLTIAGDTQISASLGITGSAGITGSFGVTGSSSITGSFNVGGPTTLTGSLSVAGDTQISASLGITGSFSTTGSVQFALPSQSAGYLVEYDPTTGLLSYANTGSLVSPTASYAISSSYANEAGKVTNALNNGVGIAAFTYDGSGVASVQVSGAASLTGNILTKWDAAAGAFLDSTITDNISGVSINNGAGVLIEQGGLYVTGASTFHDSVVFQGDITVQGTASFQNATNLAVADQFILLNSGSATFQDSGIVINTGNAGNSGSAWFLETAGTTTGTSSQNGRFAVAGNVLPDATTVTAEEYANTTRIDAGDPFTQYPVPQFGGTLTGQGNMYVDSSNGDIYIYA